MAEIPQSTPTEGADKWNAYDAVTAENNDKIAQLGAEHAEKGLVQRALGKRALKKNIEALDINTSQAFIDTVTNDEPYLTARKNELDDLRKANKN